MLRVGADHAATGENAVLANCRRTDVILDPIGICITDALYGEVTPAMARAVGQANARRIPVPTGRCGNVILGAKSLSAAELRESVTRELQRFEDEREG